MFRYKILVDKVEIEWFRAGPIGDGEIEHRHTVRLRQENIVLYGE